MIPGREKRPNVPGRRDAKINTNGAIKRRIVQNLLKSLRISGKNRAIGITTQMKPDDLIRLGMPKASRRWIDG